MGRAYSAFCITTMIKLGDGVGAEGQVQGNQTAQKHVPEVTTSPRCGTCVRGSLDLPPPCNSDWGWGEVAEGKREGERGCTGLGQGGGRFGGVISCWGASELDPSISEWSLQDPQTEDRSGGWSQETGGAPGLQQQGGVLRGQCWTPRGIGGPPGLTERRVSTTSWEPASGTQLPPPQQEGQAARAPPAGLPGQRAGTQPQAFFPSPPQLNVPLSLPGPWSLVRPQPGQGLKRTLKSPGPAHRGGQ